MSDTELRDDLLDLLTDEVAVLDGPIAADTDLLLSGAVDSLGVVRIVDWLEERLDIEIDPADVVLENFVTVDAMVAYVGRRAGSTTP